jgi:CarD family transcriptional regulator
MSRIAAYAPVMSSSPPFFLVGKALYEFAWVHAGRESIENSRAEAEVSRLLAQSPYSVLYESRIRTCQKEKTRNMSKAKKLADFRPNDFVVYPAHGVGKIVSIDQQEVAGLSLEMFVISFEKDKMTLRVPTAKASSVGMRPLSSADIVERALETLKGRARVKRAMWSRRAQEYEQKINSGDLISIAEVVRDLHRNDDQREQSYSERQLYEAALERLTREVAAVNGIEEVKAQQHVDLVLGGRVAA